MLLAFMTPSTLLLLESASLTGLVLLSFFGWLSAISALRTLKRTRAKSEPVTKQQFSTGTVSGSSKLKESLATECGTLSLSPKPNGAAGKAGFVV